MLFPALTPPRWQASTLGSPSTAPWGDLDRVFRNFLEGIESLSHRSAVFPQVNLRSTEDALHLEAAVPGFTLDQIEVTVHDDHLWLEGRVEKVEEDDSSSYHRRERVTRAFRRAIPLPVPVEADQVTANLGNGMLTVELPKAKAARARRIEVRSSRP